MRSATVFLCLLAVAGCGGGAEDDAADAPEATTSLTVVVQPRGEDGPSRETTLTCDPPGGTHPDPAAACAALEAEPAALEPLGDDVACTQIYGGPERAAVDGVLAGRDVHAELNRANGCEIDRWERLQALLANG